MIAQLNLFAKDKYKRHSRASKVVRQLRREGRKGFRVTKRHQLFPIMECDKSGLFVIFDNFTQYSSEYFESLYLAVALFSQHLFKYLVSSKLQPKEM